MELDLNKFRTLIPVSSLYEENLSQVAKQTDVDRYYKGELLFRIGDNDDDYVFLLAGSVEQTDAFGHKTRILAGSAEADYALANLKPRRFSAEVTSETATIARVNCQLLEKHLTWGQVVMESSAGMTVDELDSQALLDSEWMMSMLQTPAFLKLPAANIQTLFERMEAVDVKQGDVVIRQGDRGDYYYIIKHGQCRVSRETNTGKTTLAELGPNKSFGEEALISQAPRNATITMSTDGMLMRLSKTNFLNLLEEPLLKYVTLAEAGRMVRDGAARIDVRLESEFNKSGIRGSLNIPLYLLRLKAPQLDKSRRYVVYCDTGTRSAAGSFILNSMGFNTCVLKDGLSAWNPHAL